MTRLFRYGRTSNVHSSTPRAKAFVNAMEDKTISNEERFALLKKACELHQYLTRKSTTGQNYPRHIFALRLAAMEIKAWSSFFDLINYDEGTLVASQSSLDQTGLMRLKDYPENGSPGGCFGIDSKRFAHRLLKAFADMREMVEDALSM
ncbi:carnitine O-palmitoyltransferase 1, liver isoform-like [Tubulanus polymorphus]|uniref:carnitine O-palmitoyltransferase 1, liver isoform-like n=1 Tax=Tubulanus polymorphus TaxID=672921 RepID=UPI003DA65E97